jgi:hypothetical protein
VVYDEEELRAFKAAQETKTYKPAVDHTPTNPDSDSVALSKFVEGTQQLHLESGLNHLADVLKAIREEQSPLRLTVPIHHKLTLSLVEASALSGISRNQLRAAIFDGTLTAQIIGRGYRNTFRLRDFFVMTGQGDKVLGGQGETAVRFINFVLSPSLLVPLSPCPNFTGKSLIRTVLGATA